MRTLYESIFDVDKNINKLNKNINNHYILANFFTLKKIEYNGESIFNIFNFNEINNDFNPCINVNSNIIKNVNESRRINDHLRLLANMIGNINIKGIIKDPNTYIYIKLVNAAYKLINHYIKTGNLKLFNIEVKRYNDDSFLLIMEFKESTISFLFENKKKYK